MDMNDSIQYSHCEAGHVWTVERAGDACPVCEGPALGTSGQIATGRGALPHWAIPAMIAGIVGVLGIMAVIAFVTGEGAEALLMFVPLLIGGTLVAAVVLLGVRASRKYAAAMQQFASQRGFVFAPEMHERLSARLACLPLFQWGHSRNSVNVLQGELNQTECIICRHQWTTGTGKNKSRHSRLVVVLPQAGRGLPEFQLGPEQWIHKVGSWFGMKDINFGGSELAAKFSSNYRLTARDEDSIRDVFTEPVVTWFAENPRWTVQSAGNALLFSRQNLSPTLKIATSTDRVPTAEELDSLLEESAAAAALLTQSRA